MTKNKQIQLILETWAKKNNKSLKEIELKFKKLNKEQKK